MKAVILAAGRGRRLKPLTDSLPKGLIKLEGRELLDYSLENLSRAGIKEALVVVGYLGEKIRKRFGKSFSGLSIRYAENKDYGSTGSMYSLSKTRGLVHEEIILLESDLVYEQKALEILLDSEASDAILVAPISGSGDEVFVLADKNGCLSNLGKKATGKEKAIGELVGISRISAGLLDEIYARAEEEYSGGNRNQHYEEVILRTSRKLKFPVKCLSGDIAWSEIDKEEDLIRARKVLSERIRPYTKHD